MTEMKHSEIFVIFEKFSARIALYISLLTLITRLALIASERFRLPFDDQDYLAYQDDLFKTEI